MKHLKILVLFFLLIASSTTAIGVEAGNPADATSALQNSIVAGVQTGGGTAEQPAGAIPSVTQAEMVRKSEEEFQRRLLGLTQATDTLEKRVAEFRRQAVAPDPQELERLDQDMTLVERELSNLSSISVSPLAQLQRSDLQDRVFALRVAMEIADRRWRSEWKVFGLDFFQSVPPLESGLQPLPSSYSIRVGDKLQVLVLSSLGAQKDYTLTVDTGGCIVLSGAGRVSAAGKTARQLQDILAKKIGSRFKQLRVEVAVQSVSSIRVQVAGEVAKPGTYIMSGFATVFSALYQAGGPTKVGTFRRISLVRQQTSTKTIDLYDFLLNGNNDQDMSLRDGDLIFVPPVGGTVGVGGEVIRPGRYEPTFPIKLSEILKMAGGAKPGGYLQSVQVEHIEKNEYRVLFSEPIKDTGGRSVFILRPGDEVTVVSVQPDKTNQVNISGPVAAPGTYGLKSGMRVSDLIELAQGFARDREIYMGRADILRIDPTTGFEIMTVNLDKAMKGDPEHNIQLNKLDRMFIYEPDQVVFRPMLVTMAGALARPGVYRRTAGMRVSDAIAAAGGVLPQAFLERADLIRYSDNETTTLVKIDLATALSGDPVANIKLQDRDELTIYTNTEVVWNDRTVRIEGAIQRPGVYVRSENMRLGDLLFAGGGLLPEAGTTAEISRCRETGSSSTLKVDLSKLGGDGAQDPLLEDRDVVTIASINPYLRSPEIVYVTGEVARPGPYVLRSQTERLAELIERAGGVTPSADTSAALFLRQRESFENTQQEEDADVILQKARIFADKQLLTQLAKMGVRLPENFMQAGSKSAQELSKPTEVVVSSEKLETNVNPNDEPTDREFRGSAEDVMRSITKQRDEKRQMSAMGPPLAQTVVETSAGFEGRQKLAAVAGSARISVNLARALDKPESPDNLMLRNGDRVFIPKVTNVITVIGAVLHPHSFAAGSGKSVDYYIERSGGYAQDAALKNVVVVRASGNALPKNLVKSVEPGDLIVVPNTGLIDVARKWEKVGNVTKVVSDILGSVFILTRF